MENIKWGIIGCGDVTEIKSGPAFNKVKNSAIVAVMRRDAVKAEDYALRHNVPRWYNDANSLINDPEVNAIYIATPPSTHEFYAIAAIDAGKPVYVEKPMALNSVAAMHMAAYAKRKHIKLSVAHYRREQPKFKFIKKLLDKKAIGDIFFTRLDYLRKPLTPESLLNAKTAWRIDPAVSGGGLFHDLAPHQLDLMVYFFGKVKEAGGIAKKQGYLYHADDLVTGSVLFESGIVFSGLWCFNVPVNEEKDHCEIIGSLGKISFSIFGNQPVLINRNNKTETISFDPLVHVQQPMIEKVTRYFLDDGYNPCSGNDGALVMNIMDKFTGIKV